jgi:chromosome segregation ATPase
MVKRADEELAQLHKRQTAAQELVAEAQQELGDLQIHSAQLQTAYSEANNRLVQAREAAHQAQIWAELATGSPSEATALAKLKDARAAEKSAEQGAQNAQKPLEAAQADLNKRSPNLQKSIDENQALVRDLVARSLPLQAAREQAHQALGDETYAHIARQLQALQSQVSSKGRSLIDSRLELNSACEAARSTLSAWPALLQQAIQDYDVYEDGVTRLLNSFLAWLDVIEEDGRALDRHPDAYTVMQQLEITPSHLRLIWDYSGPGADGQKMLFIRREKIRGILKQYMQAHQ